MGQRKLVVFGGKEFDKKPLNDLWILDLQSNEWLEVADLQFPLSPRKGHSAVMIDNLMLLYGGRSSSTKYFGDLTILTFDENWSPKSWKEVDSSTGAMPSQRNHHIAAALPNKEMVIYGGRKDHDEVSDILTDLWIYSLTENKWTEVIPIPDRSLPMFLAYPKPRIEAASAKVSDSVLLIASGRDYVGDVLNDAWSLDFTNVNEVSWKSLAPIDCEDVAVSTSVMYASTGFFVTLAVVLGLIFYFNIQSRRAPYERIG